MLPDSPPDSSSEHCLSSPGYPAILSPSELALSAQLYRDPVLYSPGPLPAPDLGRVDYSAPLQIIEAAGQAEAVRIAVRQETRQPDIKKEPCQPAAAAVPAPHRKKRRREVSEECGAGLPLPGPALAPGQVKIKSEVESEQTQSLSFTPFQSGRWCPTASADCRPLPAPVLKVTADKGFNFSPADDAFIAQKKNHFQLTCHVSKEGLQELVSTQTGYKQIDYMQLSFYGVKKEAPEQQIKVLCKAELSNYALVSDSKWLNCRDIFK